IWKDKLIFWLFLLIVLYVFHLFYTPVPGLLAIETLRILIFFLYLIALIFCISKSEHFLKIIKAFVYSGFVLSLIGILQYFWGSQFWSWRGDLLNSEIPRITATVSDPNIYARYVVIWIIFTLSYFLYTKNKKQRIFLFLILVSELLALLFSYSRGGWIAFILSIFFFLFLYCRYCSSGKYLRIVSVLAGLILIVSIIFVAFPEIKNNVLFRLNPNVLFLKEGTGRGELLRVSLKMFSDNPILGIGLFGFSESMRNTYPNMVLAVFHSTLPQSHFFSSVLAETGLIGLTIYLFIIFFFFKNVIFVLKNTKNYFYKLNAIALGCSFFAILIASQGEGRFYQEPFLWVIMGLVISLRTMVKKETRKRLLHKAL
ncbi:O-antigen ligase family protein, partial [bacterium]|nr:O-antigen ligase family protein [bacterium]